MSLSSGFMRAQQDKKYGQCMYNVMLGCIRIIVVPMEILCIFNIHMFLSTIK